MKRSFVYTANTLFILFIYIYFIYTFYLFYLSLREKTICEVYFKYTLSILHLYFEPLKSNISML